MKIKMILPIAVFSSMVLISCGGGGGGGSDDDNGYSGVTSQASIDADNADDLAVAATGGAAQAIAADNAPTLLRPSPAASALLALSTRLAKKMSTANRTANQLIDGVCSSGSVDVTNNSDTNMTMVFNNCVVIGGGAGEIINGKVTFVQHSNGSFTFRYINFTMVYLGETYTLNMTVECNSSYDCTWATDYSGPDGRTYRVEGASVTSYSGSTYGVTATVYDPDYGYITIVADVTYGSCTGGVPSSGSITYTGSGSLSGGVTFNDCNSFTVTDHMGSSITYNWADILS